MRMTSSPADFVSAAGSVISADADDLARYFSEQSVGDPLGLGQIRHQRAH